jgi:hypothetical protein
MKTTYVEQETTDYGMFKYMDGNRSVEQSRVNKIKASIKKYGQLDPIEVNEKYEVGDGQGRLEACKQLKIPVKYKIIPGRTIEDYIAINSVSTNWTTLDYTDSWIKRAPNAKVRKAYQDIQTLITNKKYTSVITRSVILRICLKNGDKYVDVIQSGKAELKYSMEDTIEMLDFILKFEDTLKIVGKRNNYIRALVRAYNTRKVNRNKLEKRCRALQYMIHGVASVDEAQKILENVYNYKCRNRIKFDTEVA